MKIPLHTVSDSYLLLDISDNFFYARLKVLFMVLRQCWWETLVLEPHETHAALQVEVLKFYVLGFVGCEVLTAVTMKNLIF
jgi:hypothetical protein